MSRRSPPEHSPAAPLRVAYVLFVFPVLSETVVVNELLALRALGVQVRVFSWTSPADKLSHVQHAAAADLARDACYMQAQRFTRAQVLAANARLLARRGARPLLAGYRLALRYRLLRGWRAFFRFVTWADQLYVGRITHLHAHFATEAAAVAHTLSVLSGIPFSFTAHAYDIYRAPEWLREKMRAAKFVATVCEANRRYLLAQIPDVHGDHVHVIRPGVDLAVFSPRPAQGLHRFLVLSVGRLVEKKGYVDLIAACDSLRRRGVDFECFIVGEGPCRSALESAIAAHRLGDLVRLLGALPRERVLPLLDDANVFVLPCRIDVETGDRDAMPLVLAEAMAKELPVVATCVSGIPELVEDGAGLLVPERDVAALADAIQRVHALDEARRREMGRRGRAIVQARFNLEYEARRLVTLFSGAASAN